MPPKYLCLLLINVNKHRKWREIQMILYLAVTSDKYELPLGIYNTLEELLKQFSSKEIQKKN